MLEKRQISLRSIFFLTLWIAIGLGLARWGWLSASAKGLERRLLMVLAFAWGGAGFGALDRSPALGALAGAVVGLYAQWQLLDG
jgi:hypothetical protein